MDSARRATIIGVSWLLVQFAVPLARLDLAQRPPFSPRFSWSMFAGRPLSTCAHDLHWTLPDGTPEVMPLPPATHPAHRVLTAHTPDEFRRVVPLLTAYADSDAVVIRALHDLLRRHKHRVDPTGRYVLTSTLSCTGLDGQHTQHSLRLGGS